MKYTYKSGGRQRSMYYLITSLYWTSPLEKVTERMGKMIIITNEEGLDSLIVTSTQVDF